MSFPNEMNITQFDTNRTKLCCNGLTSSIHCSTVSFGRCQKSTMANIFLQRRNHGLNSKDIQRFIDEVNANKKSVLEERKKQEQEEMFSLLKKWKKPDDVLVLEPMKKEIVEIKGEVLTQWEVTVLAPLVYHEPKLSEEKLELYHMEFKSKQERRKNWMNEKLQLLGTITGENIPK